MQLPRIVASLTLSLFIPTALYDELMALFMRLSAPFVWDLAHGKDLECEPLSCPP